MCRDDLFRLCLKRKGKLLPCLLSLYPLNVISLSPDVECVGFVSEWLCNASCFGKMLSNAILPATQSNALSHIVTLV